jgi:restriction system protein
MNKQSIDSVPAYQDLMLPILQVLSEHGELHRRDYSRLAGEQMGLSEEAMRSMLPSGNESYLYNRSGWAGWYMQQAGLCRKPRRGNLEITEEGRKLLAESPSSLSKLK